MPVKRLLIVCIGNSCRSQMAEGFLKSFEPRVEVHSAGTQPAPLTHPYAVLAMREAGIDISDAAPKNVDQFTGQSFDWVITVCDDAAETCPTFPGEVKNLAHIGFEDPAQAQGTHEEVLCVFRRVRNEIQERFQKFYETHIERK